MRRHATTSTAGCALLLALAVAAAAASKCPDQCDCFKRKVDCSNRGLEFIPFGIPKTTVFLDLSGNRFSALDVDRLSPLKRLSTLNLARNQLRTPALEDATESLAKIADLNLQQNELDRIPSNLYVMQRLTRLDLSWNNISELDTRNVLDISTIRKVLLSHNRIVSWQKPSAMDFAAAPQASILSLDLSHNRLTALQPGGFRALSTLQHLNLSSNFIVELESSAFRDLQSLSALDLSRNRLSTLSKSLLFEHMPLLAELSLAENQISRLADGTFFKLKHLTFLNLSSNEIQNVSGAWLFGLESLATLDLSRNRIGWLDAAAWPEASEWRTLILDRNRLRSLPSNAFRKLQKLQTLGLAGNSIEQLHKSAFSGLHELQILDLSSNALAACVEDGAILYNTSLPFLKELRFANNSLKAVPPRAFERFPSLEILDLRENAIATIHYGAFEPLQLSVLYLNTSSLLCDCKLDWWTNWLIGSRVDRSFVQTKCSHPLHLAGIEVTVIDVANLTCLHESPRPKISEHPAVSVKATVGSDVRLTCSGYGDSPLRMEWRVIESGFRRRTLHEDGETTMTVNTTELLFSSRAVVHGELLLAHVNLTDKAEYQCIIRNQFGADYSSKTSLEVQQIPVFLKKPQDIVLLAGQSTGLECAVTGSPTPVITWQKDSNLSFPAADEHRLHVKQDDDHLYVLNVKPEDAGTYTCHARNDAGHVQTSAVMTVYNNSFSKSLPSSLSVTEGETLILDCAIDLKDGQRMHWRKTQHSNSERSFTISGNSRLTLNAKNDTMVLKKTEAEDSGVYSCELFAGTHFLDKHSFRVQVVPIVERQVELTLSKYLNSMNESIYLLAIVVTLFVLLCISWTIMYYRRASVELRVADGRTYRTVEYR